MRGNPLIPTLLTATIAIGLTAYPQIPQREVQSRAYAGHESDRDGRQVVIFGKGVGPDENSIQ